MIEQRNRATLDSKNLFMYDTRLYDNNCMMLIVDMLSVRDFTTRAGKLAFNLKRIAIGQVFESIGCRIYRCV